MPLHALAHRLREGLLLIGVVSGLLGSVPSLVWAAGALTIVFAPVLAAVSVWLYTLVFAFASLWFAHFTLASLQRLRASEAAQAAQAGSTALVPGSSPSQGVRLT